VSRRAFIATGAVMLVVGTAVRINNAMRFPILRGYDAFAHFSYVWFLAETGRVPSATAGWEFFQPPAYYAFMLAFWKALPEMDPVVRLHVGTAVVAVLGLIHAAVCFVVVRRYFPHDRLVQLLAPGLMLFLPVHLYSSGFLGNEVLGAALCALGLLALLWTLQRETLARAALLGLVLGLAMLVKFTAMAIVVAAFATLGLRAVVQARLARGAATVAVVAAVVFAVCGWFYVRNAVTYGNPFQMSREQLFLAHIENAQPQGRRTILEYVLFDPGILWEPQWPRGEPLYRRQRVDSDYSALRHSIPTGLYANTWFDGYGAFVLPPIEWRPTVRGAGQLLLTFGMVPTIVMMLGVWTGLGDLRRRKWDDTLVTMLLASASMAAIVVLGTRSVPTQAAVKATYLMPISVAFGFWFALGVERLRRSRPRWVRQVAVLSAALAGLSVAVFTHNLFKDNSWMTEGRGGPAFRNLYGMIYYAANDRAGAAKLFEWAAKEQWPLAFENLAALELQDGRPEQALYRLDQATGIKRIDLAIVPDDQRPYVRATLAEYFISRAVILHQLGRNDEALAAVEEAGRLGPSIPEVSYNLGVLKLIQAAQDDGPRRGALLKQARRAFATSAELDPAFHEAVAMAGVARTLAGHCVAGAAMIRRALAPHPGEFRAYPVETGPGDQNAAGIDRRRRIERVPTALDPATRLNACSASDA
jgi:tetratricopeptide (TPR) repeat protein